MSAIVVGVSTGAVRARSSPSRRSWSCRGNLIYARTDGGLYAATSGRDKLALAVRRVAPGGVGDAASGRVLHDAGRCPGGGTTTEGASEVVAVSRDGSEVVPLDSGWVGAGGGTGWPDVASGRLEKIALSVQGQHRTGRADLVSVPVRAGPTIDWTPP